MTSITDAVRAGVKGIYAGEAGVELLIRQGKAIRDGAPWITRSDDGAAAFVDVDKLLDAGGVCSGGEYRVVQIACSLLGGPPVDLSDDTGALSYPQGRITPQAGAPTPKRPTSGVR